MIYHGSCHCQAVQFEVDAPAALEADYCNCTICRKSGYLHLIVPRSKFRLLSGEEVLTNYRFNTKIAQHTFCKICGIKPFYIPRSNPDGIDVNVNCLDTPPASVKVTDFDGQHWEQHAHKLAHKSIDAAPANEPPSPKAVVLAWVACFNQADIDGLCALYHDDAVNHQVVTEPLRGLAAIRQLFETEFGRANMQCEIAQLHEAGDWAILEWQDPLGLQGCGFFLVEAGKIRHQRGYFDQLSFFRAQHLSVPDTYLDQQPTHNKNDK
ncbi:nuclear transport factor 2 family protein [Shewanella dokdonensis]|uniref:GFA family protein n=1 Tax=Shewanella dokdonensis TaxID=712036 RepID=UPI001FD32D0E|nr:nuclear transport factor 2 family protein [Shewanella dokdonensis]MCL1076203.1 nuclear transport factor 2 family protein [Shewanella dokdonensis]